MDPTIAPTIPAPPPSVEDRARASRGGSSGAVHAPVARVIRARHPGGGTPLDVGCGTGAL